MFKGVWEKFNKLCDDEVIVSVKDVYDEIKQGSDWLVEWATKHQKIFLEPINVGEFKLIGEMQEKRSILD